MAFAVIIGHGHSKVIVRFPTPEQAMTEARNQIEHGTTDLKIRVAATSEEFTPAEFEARVASLAGDQGIAKWMSSRRASVPADGE